MAPPKIKTSTITVPLQGLKKRAFSPVPTQLLTSHLDSYRSSFPDDDQSHWRPQHRGQVEPPASPAWLETASEMEHYVRSGESARDMADFALGEVKGCGQALKTTVLGTARLVRHPVVSADRLGRAVMSSGPALSVESGWSCRVGNDR